MPPPTRSTDDTCNSTVVSYQLIQAARAHRSRAHSILAEAGLYPGQELVLMALYNDDGQTLGALAAGLCVQPATITKMVNRMERGGLLSREPDPDDGRVKRIFLTDEARALRSQTRQAWASLEAETVSRLSADEQATLANLLGKVLDGLREAQPTE